MFCVCVCHVAQYFYGSQTVSKGWSENGDRTSLSEDKNHLFGASPTCSNQTILLVLRPIPLPIFIYLIIYIYIYWLVVLTILKHISQWEGLSHILWKIKNV